MKEAHTFKGPGNKDVGSEGPKIGSNAAALSTELSAKPSRERDDPPDTLTVNTKDNAEETGFSRLASDNGDAGLTEGGARFLRRLNSRVEKEEDEEIERCFVEKILQQNEANRASCQSVPFTLAFFFLYALGVITHERITTLHLIEDGISEGLLSSTFDEAQSKDVFDCTTAADVWNFLQSTVVSSDSSPWFQRIDRFGKVSQAAAENSSTIDDLAFNHFHLIGGLVLEQVRSLDSECKTEIESPEGWSCISRSEEMDSAPYGPALHAGNVSATINFPGEGFKPLFAQGEVGHGEGRLDWDHTYRRLRSHGGNDATGQTSLQRWVESNPLYRQLRAAARGDGDGEDGSEGSIARKFWAPPHLRYSMFLMENMAMSDLQERLSYLKDNRWLDSRTSHLDLKASLVSLENNLVARVNVMFHFSRKSSLDVHFRVTTLPLKVYDHWYYLIIDLSWLALLLMIFSTELKEVTYSIRKGTLSDYLFDFWNCLDWVTIFCGFALVAGWIHTVFQVDEMFQRMKDCPRPPTQMTEENMKTVYLMHLDIESLGNFVMYYRLVQSAYVLIIMLRFFKAFRAQPRLALVTTTIFVAGVDLAHFMIVFCSIFLTYALAGVFLFGRRLTAFSSWPKAISKCFAIACGEFAWGEMAAEHPVTTALWFWSFELIIYFILLNMVMAIILDVYAEVRSQSAHCPPLWVQMMNGARSLKANGWSSHTLRIDAEEKLLKAISDMPEKVSEKYLAEEIPEMKSDHVKDILSAAKTLEARQSEEHLRLSDAIKMIAAMHSSLDSMVKLKDVQSMEKRQHKLRSTESSNLANQVSELTDLVKGMMQTQQQTSNGEMTKSPAKQTSDLVSSEIAIGKLAQEVEESKQLIWQVESSHHADMAFLRQELTELRECMTASKMVRSHEVPSDSAVQEATKMHPNAIAQEITNGNAIAQELAKCRDSSLEIMQIMRQEMSAVHERMEVLSNLIVSRNSDVCVEIDKIACGMEGLLKYSDSSKLANIIADKMGHPLNLPGNDSKSGDSATKYRSNSATAEEPEFTQKAVASDENETKQTRGIHATTGGQEDNRVVVASRFGGPGFSQPQASHDDRYEYQPSHHRGKPMRTTPPRPGHGASRPVHMHHRRPHSREHVELYGRPIGQGRGRPYSAVAPHHGHYLPGQVVALPGHVQPTYHLVRVEPGSRDHIARPRGPHRHHSPNHRWRTRSSDPTGGYYDEYLEFPDETI